MCSGSLQGARQLEPKAGLIGVELRGIPANGYGLGAPHVLEVDRLAARRVVIVGGGQLVARRHLRRRGSSRRRRGRGALGPLELVDPRSRELGVEGFLVAGDETLQQRDVLRLLGRAPGLGGLA